ncbi:MAG: hypothetical protein KatS3mg014_1558 [Actinomycetota bacterium]|nr:MAG: hypothetical protein KatS3mg014_1558 [Actinomycetota bacterium]
MTCAEVRERLSDHLLDALPDAEELAVRHHLRGCGPCRAELRALEEGLAVAAASVPPVEPPPALRERVLGALEEEWLETPAAPRRERAPWLVAAAAAVAVLLSVVWGVGQARRAERAAAEAASYERVLAVLGGTGFRVGEIRPVGASGIRGSVLVYRSAWGRSWAALFLRVPGAPGELRAELTGPGGASLPFETVWVRDGQGEGWLTTDLEVDALDRVWVRDADGTLLAAGRVTEA